MASLVAWVLIVAAIGAAGTRPVPTGTNDVTENVVGTICELQLRRDTTGTPNAGNLREPTSRHQGLAQAGKASVTMLT